MTTIDTPVNNCVVSRKFRKSPRRSLVAVVPLMLILGACGDDDDTSSSDTAAKSVSEIPQLTFDGSDCVHEGPEQMAAGVVAVEFVNDSDGLANVQVMLLDEGKTIQDYIDQFLPDQSSSHFPRFASDMGGQPPAKAGETTTWEASLAAGQYIALCGTSGNPPAIGLGLTVVDS